MVGATMEKIEGNVQVVRSLVARHIAKHSVRDPSLRDLPPMEQEPVFDPPRCETHPIESIDLSTVSTVIFATGYNMEFERFVDVPSLCDDAGYPHQYRGVSSAAQGLYFVGLPWLHKWASVTLLGAPEDAEYVASHIAKHVSVTKPSPTTPARPAAVTDSTLGDLSSRASKMASRQSCMYR